MADPQQQVSGRYLRRACEFLKRNCAIAENSVLFLISGAAEQILEELSPRCPCEKTQAIYYSVASVCGPFVVLFFLGIVMKRKTWLCAHGRYKIDKSLRGECFCTSCEIMGQALILPMGWICFAFFDGDYYACLTSGSCVKTSDAFLSKKAESLAISWLIAAIFLALSIFVVCCWRCSDGYSYLQNQYVERLKIEEMQFIELKMQENIDKNPAKLGSKILNAEKLKKKDWDSLTKKIQSPVLEFENEEIQVLATQA